MRLYHYCSINTFEKIIVGKSLRMSDITKSNDSMELKYAIDVVRSAIRAALNAEKAKFYVEYMKEDKIDTITSAIVERIEKKVKSITCYTICFSQEPDLLSQWRGYASDGKGVAIGIEYAALQDFAKKQEMYLSKIVYDKRQQSKKMREIANELAKEIKGIIKTGTDIEEITTKIDLERVKYNDRFIKEMVRSKSIFFKEEKEWRLYYYDDNRDNNSEYCFGDYGCKRYIEIKLNEILGDSMLDVRLGPKNTADISDIVGFINKNGMLCAVKKSKGSYR